MPSRFDLVPRVITPSQKFLVLAWLTSNMGSLLMLLTTADIRPSFHRSPIARPRLDLGSVQPGPHCWLMSLNFPSPAFQYRSLGSRYVDPRWAVSTSG